MSPPFDHALRRHGPVDKPRVVAGGMADTGGARPETAGASKPAYNQLNWAAAKSADDAKAGLSRAAACG